MNQQEKSATYEDEINLYDYWKVIVKRKKLIIGLFLISVVCAAVISLLIPEIYRGEVILKIPSEKIIPPKEMVSIIGKLDKEKLNQILPNTYTSITNIKVMSLKDSTDKLQVIIEAKKVDDIPAAISEFVESINSFHLVKQVVDHEKERLLKQSEELSKVLESSRELAKTYDKLLKAGKLSIIGFNPIEINKRILDIKIEKLQVERDLQRLKGIGIVAQPFISKRPVKPNIKMNIALTGMISLFAGIFLAFLWNILKS